MSQPEPEVILATEREAGLREQTLREMRRKRHAYGHEVVALVDEVLALRAERDSKLPAAALSRADRVREMARLIDSTMYWDKTPQGHRFWENVKDQLQANADLIEADPKAFDPY